jgi:hypothetical protein
MARLWVWIVTLGFVVLPMAEALAGLKDGSGF